MTVDDVAGLARVLRALRPDEVGGTIGEKRLWAQACHDVLRFVCILRPQSTDPAGFLAACGLEEPTQGGNNGNP